MQNNDELLDKFSQLKSELDTLLKLIKRNNNQHRKSKPHILLKTVYRYSSIISDQSDSIVSLNVDAERVLKSRHKLSGVALKESIRYLLGLHKVVALATQTIVWIEKAAKEIGGYIAQMVFLPLYTMYLALAARLHSIMTTLAMHHFKRFEVLRSALEAASKLFPQHHETISTAIAAYALPKSVVEFIMTLTAHVENGNQVEMNKNACHSFKKEDDNVLESTVGISGQNRNDIDDIGEDIGCDSISKSNLERKKQCMSVRKSNSFREYDTREDKGKGDILVMSTLTGSVNDNGKRNKKDDDEQLKTAIGKKIKGSHFPDTPGIISEEKNDDSSLMSCSIGEHLTSASPSHSQIKTFASTEKRKKSKKKQKRKLGECGGDDIDNIFGTLPL